MKTKNINQHASIGDLIVINDSDLDDAHLPYLIVGHDENDVVLLLSTAGELVQIFGQQINQHCRIVRGEL